METKGKPGIVYYVERREHTLSDRDGTAYDGESRACDPDLSPDFAALEDAEAWMRAQAESEEIEIVTETRYGNGTVTRGVYEVYASAYDADEDAYVPCDADGNEAETLGDAVLGTLDVLDLHPEVFKAWKKANGSFCTWLDHADGGAGFVGFEQALAETLGEDWDELPYIKR